MLKHVCACVYVCVCVSFLVSQWDVPPDFQVPAAHPTQSSSSTTPFSSATPHPDSVTASALSVSSANQDKDGGEQAAMAENDHAGDRKRPVKDGEEGGYSQPPPQKRPNPYGAWTTVALRCA